MGQWHISIRGTGVHHNADLPADANRLAAGFVKVLKDAGHSIAAATFTSGSEEDLEHTNRPALLDVVTPEEAER